MSDRSPIDQQVHDLINEANLLFLEMLLPGSKAASKAPALVVRLLDWSDRLRETGKDKSAANLRDVAGMLEREASKARQ